MRKEKNNFVFSRKKKKTFVTIPIMKTFRWQWLHFYIEFRLFENIRCLSVCNFLKFKICKEDARF